jgi:hypothetical protein
MMKLVIALGLTALTAFATSGSSQTTMKDRIFRLRVEEKKVCFRQEKKKEEEPLKKKKRKNLRGGRFYVHSKLGSREAKVRKVLESIYRRPFPSCRPDFLKNPHTGRNLELDMYCPELRLAVECDGEQHAGFLPWFHNTYSDFEKQQERDLMKAVMCKKRGIRLIRVPHSVALDELEVYIIQQLAKK